MINPDRHSDDRSLLAERAHAAETGVCAVKFGWTCHCHNGYLRALTPRIRRKAYRRPVYVLQVTLQPAAKAAQAVKMDALTCCHQSAHGPQLSQYGVST
jgi:hypothetical protein